MGMGLVARCSEQFLESGDIGTLANATMGLGSSQR
jgi:hypothetical protein